MSDKVDRIARRIKAEHEALDGYANLSGDLVPNDLAQAYAAQARLHALHAQDIEKGRGVLGGRKIALASKVQQELCGIDHPIAGGIFEKEIMMSPATIERRSYHGLGIEFELAVKLGRQLTAEHGPYDKTTVKQAIASVHPAFELIVDRGADYADIDPLTMVADNAWSAGIVLGPEIPGGVDMDLDSLPAVLHWQDEPSVEAVTGDADPLGSLAWVVNLVTGMGGIMQAGDTIITGSVIKTRYPTAAIRARYEIAGISSVELSIV